MLRNAASKVMWVGRATVFLVGLAVILALLFGVASTALGANGKPFVLGKKNTASKVSKLVKSGVGPALSLSVGSGPPMAVNSSEKVTNLNADKLDGQDSSQLLPGDLPSGTSVYGVFRVQGPASASGQFFANDISFGYRLPSRATPHYIKKGSPVPAGCFGDVNDPGAEPGHLCAFEKTSGNVTSLRDLEVGGFRTGSAVYMESAGAGNTFIEGTWAVTAP